MVKYHTALLVVLFGYQTVVERGGGRGALARELHHVLQLVHHRHVLLDHAVVAQHQLAPHGQLVLDDGLGVGVAQEDGVLFGATRGDAHLGTVGVEVVFEIAGGVVLDTTLATADRHPAFGTAQCQTVLVGAERVDVERVCGGLHPDAIRNEGHRTERPVALLGDHHECSGNLVVGGFGLDVHCGGLLVPALAHLERDATFRTRDNHRFRGVLAVGTNGEGVVVVDVVDLQALDVLEDGVLG